MVSFDGFRWDYTDLYNTPNFDALATGLYPDHNGKINNSFYAEDLDGIYRIRDRSMVRNPDAYFGEFFLGGSEAPVKGVSPSYWKV